MTSKLNRRALMQSAAAGGALALCPPLARADDAMPPRPALEVFSRKQYVDQVALSPNGQHVALITQDGDTKYLVTADIDGQKTKSIKVGAVKVRGVLWGDDRHVVVVSSSTTTLPEMGDDKQEFYQANVIDIETAKGYTLFENMMPDFHNIVLSNVERINVDGKYRLVASNYDSSQRYARSLYSFGIGDNTRSLIHQAPHGEADWVLAPDGEVVAFGEIDGMNEVWKLQYNVADIGKPAAFKTIYTYADYKHSPDVLGIGRDGASIVVEFSSNNSVSRFHEISPDGKLSEPLDAEHEGMTRTPLFHPVTKCLCGFRLHKDWFSSTYYDPFMKSLNEAVHTMMGEGYRVSVRDYAEDPRQMIVYGESAGDAGTYYYADFVKGKVKLLARNYPDLPTGWITQKQPIDYPAADGLNIHAYLTLPPYKSPKNLPLVVLPHGGPQVQDYIDFDWQAQALGSLGYAVLQPNYRGSTGYGEAFVKAGHGEWGHKMQTDLSDGVRYLVGKGMVDPTRVAILGASYGGYAALAGATLDPGIYKCAVSIAGPSDLQAMIDWEAGRTGGYESGTVKWWHDLMGDPKKYDDCSPAKQAAKAYCPILMIHGTDDTVVPIDQSQRMEKALKAAGKSVDFVTYKGQDHWETVSSTRVDMMKVAVDFLTKYNPAT